MDDSINDNDSNCSDTESISDLDPNTIDLTDGDFTQINTKLLNIASYNINSITHGSRKDEIEIIAHQLNLAVICLTETKLDDNVHPSCYAIQGYNIEHKHRTRRGGGVCIYIRDDIPYVRSTKIESKTLEHLAIDLTVKSKKYNISVLYRPPSRSTIEQSALQEDLKFLENLEITLSKIRSHRAAYKLICGDMNFGDCYNCFGGLNGKSLDEKAAPMFLEKSFYQLVDIPTRKFNESVSLIDLIFINKTDDVVLTAVTPPISDHSGTIVSLNTLNFKKPPKETVIYDYDAANWTSIESRLCELKIPDLDNVDINKVTLDFTTTLQNIRNEYVPHKRVKIFEKDQPWFDKDTRRKLTRKNRAFKVYSKAIDQVKRMNTVSNNNAKTSKLFEKYKAAKKDFEYSSRKSKQNYFNNLKKTLSNPEISSKKKFTILKRITNTGKNSNIPPLIDNDQIIHKPEKKAEIFNTHFAKKSKLNNAQDAPPELEPIQTHYDLNDITTSYLEIGPLIKDLKNADFSPCGIPSRFLKEIYSRYGSKISAPISKLLNLIFKSGVYPDTWKIANITPVHKKNGAKTDKTNWRPISILPTLSKLAESVIHNRILRHLLDNNIITDKQAAYLPKDSTTNQLVYIVHQIKANWIKKKISHACFLDISAAFDAVWHNALIAKLKQINVIGKPLELLRSYLNNRKAKTIVDGAESPELPINAGVPQGSRLGPLLFILFINDIINDLESTPHIFADDTTLITSGTDIHETSNLLNRDLVKVSDWAKKWKVTFNTGKTKDLVFSKNAINDQPPLTFNNKPVDRVKSHKHLGIILTHNLSWDEHLNKIIKQVNLKLSMLYNVRQLSRKTLDAMYKMHVRSCIDYCIQVYGPCLNASQIDKLDRLQYRAAKLTTMALKYTSKQKIFIELGWESIEKRIEYLSLCLFHKIHIHETRSLVRQCLPPTIQYPRFTRSNKYYNSYPVTNKDFCNSFFPRSSETWNNLPFYLRNMNMVDFKTELGKLMKPQKSKLLSCGSRFGNSIHTQLRLGHSQLNDHLFNVRLSATTRCLCGGLETTEHYLHDCFLYDTERKTLHEELQGVLEHNLGKYSKRELTQILLHGEKPDNPDKYQHNKLLFRYVQKYLIQTKRLVFKSKLQYIP